MMRRVVVGVVVAAIVLSAAAWSGASAPAVAIPTGVTAPAGDVSGPRVPATPTDVDTGSVRATILAGQGGHRARDGTSPPVDRWVDGVIGGDATGTTAPPEGHGTAAWLGTAAAGLSAIDAQRGSDPVRLTIDAVGVDAPIVPVGSDPWTGQMDVVDNVTEVGWFAPGPAPGDPGSSVLAAHVDMANAGPGVFFLLDQLAVGDTVVVTHGDGSVLSYGVTGTRTVDKGMLDLDAVFTQSGPSTLTLITCGGGFNRSLRRYDSNVVVVAEPIGGGS